MQSKSLAIRLETSADFREVEHITREAFWNHHVPGCDEHYLAHILRKQSCFLPELDFVAELDGRLVGNIMYTRAIVRGDDQHDYPTLTFGPLSVLPEHQGVGIGGALVRHSLEAARGLKFPAVLIYGDTAYYCRFGFAPAERYRIGTRYHTYADALQAIELIPGALSGKPGLFIEDPAFEINEAKAEKFNRHFSPKQRQSGLPSQARFLETLAMSKPRQ